MAVIAVINRKGGSGKSTLATHLAVHLARRAGGARILLGDLDRQQSARSWLKRRATARRGDITGWPIEPRAMVRPPANASHVVLDTPGGMHGFELARVVMYADAILMPVCESLFDRESAADCLAELHAMPRVATRRCKLAAVAMRVDPRSSASETIEQWAQSLRLPLVGQLSYSSYYARCMEGGATVLEMPARQARHLHDQWQPILAWLDGALAPPAQAADWQGSRNITQPLPLDTPTAPSADAEATQNAPEASAPSAVRRLLGPAVPQFLRRDRSAP